MSDSRLGLVTVLAQRQSVDEEFLGELVDRECDALGVQGNVVWIDDLASVPDAARIAHRLGQALVVVPEPGSPQLGELVADAPKQTIRVDLSQCDNDSTGYLLAHIQGRGIDGVAWALRILQHQCQWTMQKIAYGNHADQHGQLRVPTVSNGRYAVAVMLHGGFWRSRWQLDLMDALSVDLAERGVASWNVEYRRPDQHGWASTVADVRAAIDHIQRLADVHRLDPSRVALIGHSAGGQLAVQAAADAQAGAEFVRPLVVAQLAGLVDLIEIHRRDLGNGAVPAALGGVPEVIPAVYAQASPMSRLPIHARQLVVVGHSDSPDLQEMNQRYARAAVGSGDEVELIKDAGDHFTVIDPRSRIWSRTADEIVWALSR